MYCDIIYHNMDIVASYRPAGVCIRKHVGMFLVLCEDQRGLNSITVVVVPYEVRVTRSSQKKIF